MKPKGVKKRPNEYDHARGCPYSRTHKKTAKMLAQVIAGGAPIYAKHGKKIAGIVLP